MDIYIMDIDNFQYYYNLLIIKHNNCLHYIHDQKLDQKIDEFYFLLSSSSLYKQKNLNPIRNSLLQNLKLFNDKLSNFTENIMNNTEFDKTPYFDFFRQIADIIHQIMYSYNIQLTHPPFTKPVSHKEAALNIYPIHPPAPAPRSPPEAAPKPHPQAPTLLHDTKNSAAPAPAAPASPEAEQQALPKLPARGLPFNNKAAPDRKEQILARQKIEAIKKNEKVKLVAKSKSNIKLNSISENIEEDNSLKSPVGIKDDESRNSPKATRNLVLINAVGDGDCFINAIFDYGLYTNKLKKIYNKIYYLIKYILKEYRNHQNYKIIKQIEENFILLKQKFNLIKNDDNINIINKSLFLVKPIPEQYTKRINIQKYYIHKHYENGDLEGRSEIYENHRYMFIKFMKFIYALYSLTINFKSFREGLKNHYFHEEFNQETLKELPKELVDFITGKYYIDNILKENTNFDKLTIDYIYQFYIGDNIYSSKMEISRFQKMFAEPITDSKYIPEEYENYIFDTSFQDDKFFISEKKLINIMNGDDYKKKYKIGKNVHNITVIHENEDHFLLCLYEDEMSYDFDDQGEIINGMLL